MTELVDQLIEKLWPRRRVLVEELPGGHTNANYLIDLGDERVVLRIPGQNTNLLGIDRDCEYQASQLAASIGVAPEVLARSKEDGWMVTRFLPGASLSPTDLAQDPRLGDVATTLRRLHGAGRIATVSNPFHIVRAYHEIVRTRDLDEPFDYGLALSRLDRIESVRAFNPSSFCHNDLVNTNFVYDGTLRVLDWEYAGMGDPFFDLANFSANNHLSSSADQSLLTSYFGRSDASLTAVLALMKVVSEVREIMWNLVQLFVSTLDFDYAAFARSRVSRYETLIDQMDFDQTLNEAAPKI
ncbi:MAG TPA: choline/ethanolamine kinase family protein [Acidimicrobiales bacterium]|nr:choline/ethanolamine kinase family protein [Acidimicrobiales bacterium]